MLIRLVTKKNLKATSQDEYLKNLKEWGFKTNPLNKTLEKIKDLMTNYHEIEKKEVILILILMGSSIRLIILNYKKD